MEGGKIRKLEVGFEDFLFNFEGRALVLLRCDMESKEQVGERALILIQGY